ncbi:transcriptional regulator, partial [Rhodococcus erythropolis]
NAPSTEVYRNAPSTEVYRSDRTTEGSEKPSA